ncbi:hypothetical protein GCM10017771_68390 [Streptomyces capitiformicae]|uniref:Uncharacterized protein n=1 Tax=Streptomyces capitiformicae TaxID=2014920 RepID=A0A919DH86_9ACTN|nr:hypothetical protein GCM10017771_68390 [Streptomyces capitiformicae]
MDPYVSLHDRVAHVEARTTQRFRAELGQVRPLQVDGESRSVPKGQGIGEGTGVEVDLAVDSRGGQVEFTRHSCARDTERMNLPGIRGRAVKQQERDHVSAYLPLGTPRCPSRRVVINRHSRTKVQHAAVPES